MREAGFDAAQLRAAGFYAKQLIVVGFDVGQLKEAGYDAAQLKVADLVFLVESGTAGQKEEAAAALKNLAYNNADNRTAIWEAGGIPPLVELAKSGFVVPWYSLDDLPSFTGAPNERGGRARDRERERERERGRAR